MSSSIVRRLLRRSPSPDFAETRTPWSRAWPWILGAALVVGATTLAVSLWSQDRLGFREEISVAGTGIATDLTNETRSVFLAIDRLAHRWEDSELDERIVDTGLYFEDFEALRALAWIEGTGGIGWRAPGSLDEGALERLAADRFPELERARRRGEVTVGPVVRGTGGDRLFTVYAPLASPGALVALFDVDDVLDRALGDHLVAGYATDISVDGRTIYHRGDPEETVPPEDWVWSRSVEVTGMPWTLRVWPRSELVRSKRSWLPGVVLASGLALAAALGLSVRSTQIARRHALELESAKRKLERSNADLEQFAYVASHDLQEPLRMVSSYVSLLERRYGDRLDQDARDFIDFAVDGATRMQRLINDLLAYSRIARREPALEAIDPDQVLADTLARLQPAIEERGALITRDALPPVVADGDQLGLLFQNLLTNGLKFSGERPPRIHVTGEAVDGRVRLSITDRGIGIPPESRERIFTIFQRLHGRDEYPGTGIGLSIAKRIVERHGGRIWVESTPGESTTFHFTLAARHEGAA